MKNKLIAILTAIMVLLGGGYGLTQLGGSGYSNNSVLAGSATNAVSLPNTYVEDNATTTDPAMADGGAVITQFLNTKGVNKIVISGFAVAGTATSGCYILPQISNDGTNWFNDTGTTTPENVSATTTISLIKRPKAIYPGLATTTFSYTPDINQADFTRLLLKQDNLSTDPTDGCQAYIEVSLKKEY